MHALNNNYCLTLFIYNAVSKTEDVTALVSDAYCSCIDIPCEVNQGILHLAIANPDAEQRDFICSAALSVSDVHETQNLPCYEISKCIDLMDNNYPPFLRVCENPMDSNRCSVCFQKLNKLSITSLRVDFFFLQRNICRGEIFYADRSYFKSILLNGKDFSDIFNTLYYDEIN